MGVNHSSSDVTVTEQCLNRPYIVIGLQKVRCIAVAEGMGCDSLRELRPPDSLIKRFLNMLFMQMITPAEYCSQISAGINCIVG